MEETATQPLNYGAQKRRYSVDASVLATKREIQSKFDLNAHLFSSDAGHVSKLTSGIEEKQRFFLRAALIPKNRWESAADF